MDMVAFTLWIAFPGQLLLEFHPTSQSNKKTQISRQMHSQTENYVSEKSYLVTESSAMTKTDLRRRLALRKPLPERLALMFPLDVEGGQPQDARLKQFDMSGQFVEVSLNGKGTLKLVEKHASLWRVQSSDSDVAPGTLVQMYDATPDAKAPDSAQTSGAVKSSILHKSSATGEAVFDYKLSEEAIKLGEEQLVCYLNVLSVMAWALQLVSTRRICAGNRRSKFVRCRGVGDGMAVLVSRLEAGPPRFVAALQVFTYDRCCTETEEGIQFDLRRRNFVADMVRRGATVHFDIRHVSGGRTGAVASRALSARSTVLRVPSTQVFSLKSVHAAVIDASRQNGCDAHAVLGLGLALERVNPSSVLADWIKLLFEDLDCMGRAVQQAKPEPERGDLRWALSVVKTRGFAFEGTRESTMLIPLADFLNHNMDALRFVATKDVMFLVRYGFRVEEQHGIHGASASSAALDGDPGYDEFMRENAAQVCLQGLQRIETKPEDPEVLLCYLEPTDMGPYRTQMRMEVKIAVSPGKCDVQILDMLAGSVDKKTNEVTFDPANKVYSEADNVVSWRDNGKGGLDMLNSSWSKSEVALPWWFPLPDAFMSKTATFVIGQIVKDGMKKANEKIAVSYAEELASVKA
ncbi:unnamed protein product [Durusdinium trenchii]|uniref:SET domain-containing protein n=1 Tax=Durusdinium trenchii TaxID=1381693 RepID=A0ABP0RXW8_9DINO